MMIKLVDELGRTHLMDGVNELTYLGAGTAGRTAAEAELEPGTFIRFGRESDTVPDRYWLIHDGFQSWIVVCAAVNAWLMNEENGRTLENLMSLPEPATA